MRYFTLLFIIVVTVIMSCRKKEDIEEDAGAIKGVVMECDSTASYHPLPNATVSASHEGTIVDSARTDSLGGYIITELEPGLYDVFVSSGAYPYADTVKGAEVKSGETTYVDTIKIDWGVDKPNIYLYPPYPMDVEVRLNFRAHGHVTMSLPKYENGWTTYAMPNGIILGKFANNEYLFYEAVIVGNWQRNAGWLVKATELENWMIECLPQLGLNEKETADFVEYWTEHLPPSEFYIFYPQDKERIDKAVSLEVFPQPDAVLRLWFYVELLDYPKEVLAPDTPGFRRFGFTVIEWGVLDIDAGHE